MREDLQLIPWLAVGSLFLRETGAGLSLLEDALRTARARAAVGALPFALNLIARDQATTDRCAVAEATYREAIDLARESGQQTELTFGLAGLAWLQARRGREQECRACALLLARGKTTRETAAALFHSPKTVEYHLRHVYQKLGVHSRDELAQTLAAQAPQTSEQGQFRAQLDHATGTSRPPGHCARSEHRRGN